MNNLTLQINSLEALERLIGGDSKVEIELRNSVVQKFAEKHLKPLANSDAFDDVKRHIIIEAEDLLAKEVGKFTKSWTGKIENIKFKPEIQDKITSETYKLVNEKIREAVDNAVKRFEDENNIKKKIDTSIAYFTEKLIQERVCQKLEEVKSKL